MNYKVGVIKRVAFLLMTMALAVAMVACEGAVGRPGASGKPGEPGKAPLLAPLIRAPFDPVMLVEKDEAKAIDLSATFYDPEGQALTYAIIAVEPAEGVVTAKLAQAMLTIAPVAEGTATITVTATDPDDKSGTASIMVTVDPEKTMRPVAVGEIDAVELDDGEIETIEDIDMYFNDPDGQALRYTVSVDKSLIATPVLGGTTGTTLSIRGDAYGAAIVTVTATDEDGLSADQAISVTVAKPMPPTPDPDPVRPVKTADISDQTLYLDDSAQTIDLAEHFSHAGDITYAVTDTVKGVVMAVEAEGTLTLTPITPATTRVTVTATADGLSVSDRFLVIVMAGSKPVPKLVAPVKTDISNQMLYQADGAHTIDLADHFSHDRAITYKVRSSVPGIVMATEAEGTLTLTPIVPGAARVTVTATADGLSTEAMFTVTVKAGSEPDPDPMPDPTPDSSPAELTFDDIETQTVDITGYIPDDAAPADYYLDSDDNKVVTANEKDGSDSIWEIDPVAFGTATISVIETANGDEVDEITVEVKNRSPALEDDQDDPTIGDIPVHTSDADAMTLNRDGTMLALYSVMLTDLHEYFGDPDEAGDDEEITYTIKSSHRDVLVRRQKDDCVRKSLGGCDIFLDFRMIPQRIDEFQLSVKAQDKAGEMSSEVVFPFWFPATPPVQTYIAHQSPANHNLRDITVGDRRGVAHKLKFEGDLLDFIGENDDVYSGTNTLKPAKEWEAPLFGDDPDGKSTSTDGSVRKIGFQFDGGISVEKGTIPAKNNFSVEDKNSYVGLRVVSTRPGTVVIQEWAYWDKDGIKAGEMGNTTEPMWHVVNDRTLDVNVRSVR